YHCFKHLNASNLDYLSIVFCTTYRLHRHLPSFPTRRSSDLVAEATSGITKTNPDVVLLDVHMPDGGGLAVLKNITNANPGYDGPDRKSTRLNSSHVSISYAVFCLKKKKNQQHSRS